MEENKSLIPEFNYHVDDILAKLSLICFFAPIMYGIFFGYLPYILYLPAIPIAIVAVALLYTVGRLLTKIVAKKRVEYSPEKSMRDYVVLKKTWLSFLCAVAIGVLFFFIALALKNWYLEAFDKGTQAHSKGYFYEAFCGIFAAFVTYYSSIVWFFHEGMFMPAAKYLTFGITAPITVYFVIPIFLPVPKFATIAFTAILVVLFLIRHIRIHSYDKMIDDLEKKQKFSSYRSKYDE